MSVDRSPKAEPESVKPERVDHVFLCGYCAMGHDAHTAECIRTRFNERLES